MHRAHFAEDTAVTEVGEGRFTGEVTDRWLVFGDVAPNGGYLMAIAARAMALVAERPDPVTLTAHFLRPAVVGPVEVTTEVVKAGRRHTTVQASLLQDGVEKVRLLGAFGDLSTAEGPTYLDRPALQLPPIEECVDVNAAADASEQASRLTPSVLRRFDHRVHADTLAFTVGRPPGRGVMEGWTRFAGGEPMDTLGLLAVADAYPPAIFNRDGVVGWVPTVELTVQIRQRPPDGYLATRFTTELVTRGYLEEDGEIWDADGNLVALSRQLALFARPSG